MQKSKLNNKTELSNKNILVRNKNISNETSDKISERGRMGVFGGLKKEIKSDFDVPEKPKPVMFNGKNVEYLQNGVKLFFKEHDSSSVYLVHKRNGSNYKSYWVSKEGESREANSKKPLSVTNTQLENKLIDLAKDFANKEETSKFINQAGQFIKQKYSSIFKFEKDIKRSEKEQALLELYKHINTKYNIIIDKESYDLCIYDESEGIYKAYDEKKFSRFLKKVVGKEFFVDEVKKLMGLFNEIKEEDPNHVAFNNCLMNIETLETRKFDPNIFTRFKVPYNWNPSADSPFFKEKICEIFDDPGKFQTFLQIVGYLFAKGNPHNKLFLLMGKGANGKSLLMQIISAIFINSSAAVPLQDFQKDFGLQPLIGKRVNLLSDLPIATIEETGQIKAITGGDDITINRKFKDPLTTKLKCKIVGAGNRLPKIMDDSYALWRRIVIIKLEKTFDGDSRDTKLTEKLLNDTEGMEWFIFNAIQAYKKIRETGWTEDTYREIREEAIKNSDPALYASEQLFEVTDSPDNFLTRKEIVDSINDFLIEHDLRIPANKSEYYDAVKKCGAKEGQKRILEEKIHGFRYIEKRELGW
ncbi:phage/plasmid primase, P4 family [Methanobacterium lacus]|uniref:Phage/plasmid primase, P4 family n=1 Tax=Methanobacterium lacus (strain AL-21) TaxID=877455 RepID=F0TCA5_METLA|nr:phage/plasmid primase, P4 family [Methanobacterium lacus]ADZ10372.1 phage/plasmid primase, P4 family [Methanobacterium lacus]